MTETSFIRKCVISARPEDGAIFTEHLASGLMTVRLDGYVICPIEKLEQVAVSLRSDVVPDEPASSV